MLEEAPQELLVRKRHGAALAVVRIIFPAEAHLSIGDLDQSMIRDGDAMRVAGKVVEHVFRPAERLLSVHDPVVAE